MDRSPSKQTRREVELLLLLSYYYSRVHFKRLLHPKQKKSFFPIYLWQYSVWVLILQCGDWLEVFFSLCSGRPSSFIPHPSSFIPHPSSFSPEQPLMTNCWFTSHKVVYLVWWKINVVMVSRAFIYCSSSAFEALNILSHFHSCIWCFDECQKLRVCVFNAHISFAVTHVLFIFLQYSSDLCRSIKLRWSCSQDFVVLWLLQRCQMENVTCVGLVAANRHRCSFSACSQCLHINYQRMR